MEKEVRIVCVGRQTQAVGVTEETTVSQALGYADMEDFQGSVYGEDANGYKHALSMSSAVNGYDKLFLTQNVKGGNQ